MARWVNVREASDLLGVSQDTVKRRLKNGELTGRQEKIPNGFKWYVQVQDESTTVGTTVEAASTVAGSTADTTVEAASTVAGSTADTTVEDGTQIALLTLEVQLLRGEKGEREQELARVWGQLEVRTREVSELHVLLQRALESREPVYLPAPTERTHDDEPEGVEERGGHWWMFWRRGSRTAQGEEG